MTENSPSPASTGTLESIIATLEDYKGRDVRVYDVSGSSIMADSFVVATGDADRHLDAMAEAIRVRFKAAPRRSIQGQSRSGWILVDLGDVVVHLFTEAQRAYYDLDALWNATARERERNRHG